MRRALDFSGENIRTVGVGWCASESERERPRMVRGSAGESGDPAKSRKSNRIVVIVGFVLLFLAIMIAVPTYYHLAYKSPVEGPCHIDLSVPLRNPTVYPNGSIVDHGDVYPEGYHFRVNGTMRGCLCALKPCIRKCCKKDEQIIKVPMRPSKCAKNPDSSPFDNFTLPVYESSGNFANVTQDHFRILYGDVCRQGKFMLTPDTDPEDKSDLMVDGKIRRFDGTYLDPTQYCLESINGSDEIRTLVCFTETEDEETKTMYTLYPIGMLTSIPFMVITFLVYAILSELRNLHGKSLMCNSASLLSAYLSLAIIQIRRDGLNNFWCVLTAFVVQFSFLASFFWLNVMCFDIWWVFSGLRPPRGSVKERDHKKFIFYSLYAWGVPLTIVGISLVMDLVPSIPDTFIKPGFGVIKCWFKDDKGTLLYFYLPIAIVEMLNIVMFITTAFKLQAHTKDTKVLKSSESSRSKETDRDRFHLYLKLFIVMGINWVMELVSFFVGGPKSLWFVTDIGNTLQGVLIFVIFVCKRRILLLLNQKLCPQWELVAGTSASGRSKVSSSRTSSTTLSKTLSDNPDRMALKPIARANSEIDE